MNYLYMPRFFFEKRREIYISRRANNSRRGGELSVGGKDAFHFESRRLNTRVARENAAAGKLSTLEAVTRRKKRSANCPRNDPLSLSLDRSSTDYDTRN